MESDLDSSNTASVRVDAGGGKQIRFNINLTTQQFREHYMLLIRCQIYRKNTTAFLLCAMLVTLQQVVQVECSRAVPLSGRTAEEKNKTSSSTEFNFPVQISVNFTKQIKLRRKRCESGEGCFRLWIPYMGFTVL